MRIDLWIALVVALVLAALPLQSARAEVFATSTSPAPPMAHSLAVSAAANQDDPEAINFDEFGLGSSITDEYAARGVVFTGDVFTSTDLSNPTAPVLSGTPRFFGPISGRFVVPGTTTPTTVNGFSLDVGFINNRNSVEVRYYDASGKQVGSTRAQQLGINELDIAYRGVASFTVSAIEAEAAGFAIDNLIVRTGAIGIKPTRMAEFGDSFSSGEGLLPEDNLEYDCGTDLHQGLYYEGTTQVFGPYLWNSESCQTATASKQRPPDLFKRNTVVYKNLCHRHGRAYPNQIRERFGIAPQNSIFVACSGAVTRNVGAPNSGGGEASYWQSPPNVHGGKTQFDTVKYFAAGGDPDLITIGIGGNDVGFKQIILTCLFQACTDPDIAGRTVATINNVGYTNVRLTLTGLRSAFPRATIVAFGYPSVIDDPSQACVPGVGPDEMAWLKNVVLGALNDVIKDAATAAGVAYADVTQATEGHGVCAADRWVNPGRFGDDFLLIGGNESFHPNQKGHDAIARFFFDHYTDGAGRLLLANPPPGNPIRPAPGAGIILGSLDAGAVKQCGASCLQPTACVQACTVYLQGAGFAPGAAMGVTLQSDPVSLGQVTADASGRFEAGFKAPVKLEPGIHTVTLDGMTADGTRQYAAQAFRVFDRLDARIAAKFSVGEKGTSVRRLLIKRLMPATHVDIVCARGGKAAERVLAGIPVRRLRGCPFTHLAFDSKAKAPKRRSTASLAGKFKATLAPGTLVRVVVTHSGESGRTLDALVRRGKAPKLTRRCTDPGLPAPTGC